MKIIHYYSLLIYHSLLFICVLSRDAADDRAEWRNSRSRRFAVSILSRSLISPGPQFVPRLQRQEESLAKNEKWIYCWQLFPVLSDEIAFVENGL